jgi:hypothetical protein
MWDILLLGVIVLAIAAMVFMPNIGGLAGAPQASKCSSCPKKAARDAMASQ